MKIAFAASPPADPESRAIAVPKGGAPTLDALDAGTQALVRGAAASARFEGEAGSIAEIFVPREGGAGRVLLLGTGSGDESDMEKAGGALAARYLTAGIADIVLDVAPAEATAKAVARLAGAAAQRAWRFDVYRTTLPERQKPTLETLTITGAPDGTDAAWTDADALTGGLELTRTLVSEPPNILYPESFVERCRELEAMGVTLTILDEAAMAELGMGALLGVSRGSVREARILAMHWNGKGGDAKPDLALVGKGVTFDTGGISLKPGAGMEDMKWDMGGAGAVAGAMKAIAGRKAKANVVGVVGLVENMPDGNAQRPGDVVTSMSGKTIEVINTDAEGRLVLCDVITWVQQTYSPGTIVDLATLTGAMIIALGNEHGGLFANDDTLADELLAASRATGDGLWRFPLSPAYDKLIDSPIADMKNVGPRGAGSITAAQFIQRFVDEGVRWAHLDIAGMVWADKPGTCYNKGATGFGVRLLDRLVRDRFEG
ncbi:leucyl aminopeptidase [Sphingomonas baiyangensis]|uniref:Probable cytosol aminopeptidase n=1 Tax=Sphingomonas baiyangensis TaxID=2572576 RepID=A0A4V5PWD0_9SPHN|nr:leucyl aminopeptidase [Sphingomonas baiyangensis]TKD51178.1 leucyl aminopeptidase [Sphingomonas baiyangensis]